MGFYLGVTKLEILGLDIVICLIKFLGNFDVRLSLRDLFIMKN